MSGEAFVCAIGLMLLVGLSNYMVIKLIELWKRSEPTYSDGEKKLELELENMRKK